LRDRENLGKNLRIAAPWTSPTQRTNATRSISAFDFSISILTILRDDFIEFSSCENATFHTNAVITIALQHIYLQGDVEKEEYNILSLLVSLLRSLSGVSCNSII
jgi:hypothetical protein